MRLALVYVPHSVNSKFHHPLDCCSALIDIFSVNFTQGELWTNIHLGTAIVCASLPTYRPLFSRLSVVTASIRSRFTSMFSSRRPLQSSKPSGSYEIGTYPSGHKRYNQLEHVGEGAFLTEVEATQGSRHSENSGEDGVWDSQIRVKNTEDVV